MCKFERIEYSCGHLGGIRRQRRSCEANRRWVEGTCRFDRRRDRVIYVRSAEMCDICRDYYRYIEFQEDTGYLT